jgi:hypothetical protein
VSSSIRYSDALNKLELVGIHDDDGVKLVAEFEKVLAAMESDRTVFYPLLVFSEIECFADAALESVTYNFYCIAKVPQC